jgi:hypothetical protein
VFKIKPVSCRVLSLKIDTEGLSSKTVNVGATIMRIFLAQWSGNHKKMIDL